MWLPPLPSFMVESIISREVECQLLQRDYFTKRIKSGAQVVPALFQPVLEPEGGLLNAIFTEPGAVHFVFLDEVAPQGTLDKRYREVRRESFGRVADVESIEIAGTRVTFPWSGLILGNPYEIPLHLTTNESYEGKIYSSTWNHMMGAKPQLFIVLRGGYKEVNVPCYNGGRDDAEDYAEHL